MENLFDINGVFGDNAEDIGKIVMLSNDGNIESVYIFNGEDLKTPEVIIDKPADMSDEEFKKQVKDFLKKAGATSKNRQDRWIKVPRDNEFGINFDEYDSKYEEAMAASVEGESVDLDMSTDKDVAAKAEEEAEEVAKTETVKYDDKLKVWLTRIGLVAAGALTVLGLQSCVKSLDKSGDVVVGPVTTTIDETDEPELPVDATDVSEYTETQEEFFSDMNTDNVTMNQYAHKLYHVLTSEDIEKAKTQGITLDEKAGYANFGFTAEELFAANLRWGATFTNEELAAINHGEMIDIDKIMSSADSDSNTFEEHLIDLLLNDDELNFSIKDSFNRLSDEEAKEFDQFLPMYKEFKQLINDGKIDEAKAKMKEMKHVLVEYAFGDNSENGKIQGLVVGTWATTLSIESQIYQFQEDITYTVFDTKTGKELEKTVKQNVMDEVTMRKLVLGFKDCPLTANGYAATIAGLPENFVVETDVPDSIVDLRLSTEVKAMEDYNAYVALIRNENANLDGSYVGAGGTVGDDFYNSNSVYDKLISGTSDVATKLAEINADLADKDINPVNMGWYKVAMAQKAIDFKDKYVKTSQGKKGDVISTGTFVAKPIADPMSIAGSYDGDIQADMDAINDNWAKNYEDPEDPERKGEKSKEDGEKHAKERQALLQGVYDATFNYFVEPALANHPELKINTSYPYDASWETSSDSEIREKWSWARADALEAVENAKIVDELNQPTPTPQPEPTKPADPTPTPAEPTPAEPTPTPDQPSDPTPTPTPDWAPVVPDDENTDSDQIGSPVADDSSSDIVDEATDGVLDSLSEDELLDLAAQLIDGYYMKPEEVTGLAKK